MLDRNGSSDVKRQGQLGSLLERLAKRSVTQERADQLPVAPDPLAPHHACRLQQVERVAGRDVERPAALRPADDGPLVGHPGLEAGSEQRNGNRLDDGCPTEYVRHPAAALPFPLRCAHAEELRIEPGSDGEDPVRTEVVLVDEAADLGAG